jgi:hypothetical protein
VRRVTAPIRREYPVVNHKRVRRIMRKMGFIRKNKRKTHGCVHARDPRLAMGDLKSLILDRWIGC